MGLQIELGPAVDHCGLDFFQIKSVTLKDDGWYDCQVNTEPKISNKSFLTVSDMWPMEGVGGGVAGVKMKDSPVLPRDAELEDGDFSASTIIGECHEQI